MVTPYRTPEPCAHPAHLVHEEPPHHDEHCECGAFRLESEGYAVWHVPESVSREAR